MLIHWAALGGHEDLVTYLLSNGFPVDPQDDVSFNKSFIYSSLNKCCIQHDKCFHGGCHL